MTHIIRDCHFFWTYYPEQATPVGTANCGILNMLARGEVHFTVLIGGHMCTICLQDCLYAPDVPINLLSVGAMMKRGFKVYFEKEGTFVHTPSTSSSGTRLTFMATVINHLLFLHCDFVLPPMPHPALPLILPTILAAPALPLSELLATSFPHVGVTPELWHHRLGHLDMDVTQDMLTKGFADGMDFSGGFFHLHCIPCIIGKHPQHPYDHPGNCASSLCKLLHINICGLVFTGQVT